MRIARQFVIKGRVQGVFFRDSTRRVARSLGITGHAVNLPNGDVEVLAYGEADAVSELEEWLRDGPRMAEVSDVSSREIAWNDVESFRTG